MSNIKNVFDISGRAMAAQLVRLNTVASNLANAGNIAGSKEEASDWLSRASYITIGCKQRENLKMGSNLMSTQD